MRSRVAAGCLSLCLLCPAASVAQTTAASAQPGPSGQVSLQPSTPLFGQSQPVFGGSSIAAPAPGFWAPFGKVPNDFARFFSSRTARIVVIGGATALAAHHWDDAGMEEAREFPLTDFRAGNIGGGMYAQLAASFGLYTVAKLSGNAELANLGGDLVRAQILTQGIVQAGKMMTRRTRPDASNSQSLPSGHTAAAFATAGVLQAHYGWKVGAPAYAFGAYVAASRMAANKHHLSDVVFGAALGIASAKTVTIGSGRAKFDLGIAPASGGAAITFTRY